MILSKQKNNQKNNNSVLPNQNNISSVLDSYINSIRDLDTAIQVICNSYLFENSYDLTSLDIKSYDYLLNLFIDVISSSIKSISEKINKNNINEININKEGFKYLIDFYSHISELIEIFTENYDNDDKEKKVIIAFKTITDALGEIFSVINNIFNTIPSDEQLLQLDNFINRSFEILNKIIDNFSKTIKTIFLKLTSIFIAVRLANMFDVEDLEVYDNIIGNVKKVYECLNSLFTGLYKNPKLVPFIMPGPNGNSLATTVLESYSFILEKIRGVFGEAMPTNLMGLAAKITGWDNTVIGIKGIKKIINELIGKRKFFNLLKSTGNIALVTSHVILYAEIMKSLRTAFAVAIPTGIFAKIANSLNTWDNITSAVEGLEKACSVTEESVGSVLKDKIFGINEIAITQFNTQLLIELRKAFFEAILTGFVAKAANSSKSWDYIYKGVLNLRLLHFLAKEESMVSYLKNKYLGINELSTAKMQTELLIELRKAFFEAILTGIVASIALNINSFQHIIKSIVQLTIFTLVIDVLLLSALPIYKNSDIILEELNLIKEIIKTLMPIFAISIILGIIALPLKFLIKPILIGLVSLIAVVVSVFGIAFLMNELNKRDINVIAEFLKLTVVFTILIPMFTILIALSVVAGLSIIGMGIIIHALFVLCIIALEISMIANLVNKQDPVEGIVKLTIVMGLLWITFKVIQKIILISIGFVFMAPILMFALLGLMVIALEINVISSIINSQNVVEAQIKLTIVTAFLFASMVGLIAVSLIAVFVLLAIPKIFFALLGVISIVLLMGLIIVPDSIITNIVKLNALLVLFLITGGLLILINKVFEIVSIGKIIMNILSLIGVIFAFIALSFVSLALIPLMFSLPFVLAAFTVITTAILFIALELKLFEMISLNKDKIDENIGIIKDSLRSIIEFMKDDNSGDVEINRDVWEVDKILALFLTAPAFAIGFVCLSFMILIAAELWVLEKIKLDKTKIIENITTINQVLTVITEFLTNDRYDNNLKIVDYEVWKNDKILAMFLMVPVVFSAILVTSMLIIIAAELWILEKIKIDKTKITENVTTILGTINLILEKLFNKDGIIKLEKDDNDNAFKIFGKNMLNMISERAAGVGAIIDMMLAVPMLIASIITVGLVLFIANTLKKLTKINFTNKDKITIGNNITTIFDTIKAINEKLNEPFNKNTDTQSQEEPWWKKAWNRVVERNDRIKSIQDGILNTGSLALVYLNTMMLSEIVDDLNKISTFNLKASDVTGKTKEIMDVCRFVADSLKAEKIKNVKVGKVEKITNVIKMLSDSVTSLMNITTNQTSITPEGQIDYCLKPIISIISFMNGTYKVDGKDYTGFSTLDIDGGLFDSGYYGKFKDIISIEELLIESGKKLQGLNLNETQVDSIISCLIKPIQKITNEIRDRQITDNELDLIERYGTITGSIIDTTKKLTSINSVNFENYSQNVIGFIENVHKNKSADLSTLKRLVSHLNSMNETSSQLETSKFGNYIKLFKDSNLINVSKIKTLKENLKEITEYSKNMSDNFEKISTVLSDKLVVVLEKMKTMLETISDFGNNTSFNLQQNNQPYSLLPTTNEINNKQNNQQKIRNEYIEANMETMLQYEKIKEQNISEIRDTLDEITLVLKSIKDNT